MKQIMSAVDISFWGVAIFWGYLTWRILEAKAFYGTSKWTITIVTAIIIYAFELGSMSLLSTSALINIPIGFFMSGMIAYLTSVIAQMKGRGPILWFVLGTFLFLIPVIILVLIPVKVRSKEK